MIRTLATTIVAELPKTVVRPILLVDMTFGDNTYHFWTGVGPLTYNTNAYIGAAALGKIEGISETSQLEAQGITITLEGIDSTYILEARNEITTSGTATVSLGFLDPLGSIVDFPLVCFSGFIDTADITFGANTGSVKFYVETRLAQLNRSRGGRYTDADQQMRFPGDACMRWASYATDRAVIWK